jgi:hypothetical protein|tara:strand:+ start:110 stop:817 length:708 start_codon:yes stop_codon:yes gene_type:complete
MGKNMLVFHNASNTSYANYADNLTSISSATTAVTLRFIGQGASATATSTDAVVLTVTAGKEEEMVELIAGAVAEARSGVTVVADDENSKYLHGNITAVDSISVDSGAGTFKNVIVGAFSSNDIAVTNAQSGSIVTVPTTGAASTITLPTSPVDGANYRFVCEADNGAHTITVAGEFEGIVVDAGDGVTQIDGTSSFVVAASKFKIGDFFEVVYSGSAGGYKINGVFKTDGAASAS